MVEQELDKKKKGLDEFVNECSKDQFLAGVIFDITKIIQLESSKPYRDIEREEVVDKLYKLLFDCIPIKFGDTLKVEEEKLRRIFYVFNHSDFTGTAYYSKFLEYVKKELKKVRLGYFTGQ